jgi:sigma-B regulation protein RsbU (phosphoserine phosphatase)
MMRAKTQIRDYLESGMELGEAIENVNRKLCDGNDAGMFATAWIGVLDYATGHVDFVNAGHNPPLLWQNGAWHWMREKSGLPLGLFEGLPYRTFSVDCGIGDQILIYTDGVTEAFSVDEEQYGEERLDNLVNRSFDLHPRELVDCVRASVAEHAEGAEQSDDITILALEIGVPPEEKAQLVVPAHVDALEQVSDFVHAELDRRLCPVRMQRQLDVALEELFVNACKHAYANVDASVERLVRVTHAYSTNPSSLTVEIIDEGVPFDPLAALHSGAAEGTGILIASKSVEEMRYERLGDFNVVTLVKRW